jgi:3-methyladenine DNA glycosylase AlkD
MFPSPKEILQQLQPLSDPQYAESIDYFAPQTPTEQGGHWTSVGVRVPVLRQFEKSLFRGLKTADDYTSLISFTDEAFQQRIRELAVIGLEGLCRVKKFWTKELLNCAHRWVPQLSGWETTDFLGVTLLGNMILQDIIKADDLLEYRDYPSVWGQRILIVAMVLPLRKGHGDVDRYLEILSWYKDSRRKMVIKAVSWALREGTKSHPDKIEAFIEKYQSDLHPLILREVRNKLQTGLKSPDR